MKNKWEVLIVKGDEASALQLKALLNDGWNMAVTQPTDAFVMNVLFKTEDTGIISPLIPATAAIGIKPKMK